MKLTSRARRQRGMAACIFAAGLTLTACGGTSSTSSSGAEQLYKGPKQGVQMSFKRTGDQVSAMVGTTVMSCGANPYASQLTFVVPGTFAVTNESFGKSFSSVTGGHKLTWQIEGHFDANGHSHGTFNEVTDVGCTSGTLPWKADRQ